MATELSERDELLHFVDAYCTNVEFKINNSSTSDKEKQLAESIKDETCRVLTAFAMRITE